MEVLEEKVLWCAAKYALCLEEGDAVEAVMHTLKPRIHEISDHTLSTLMTAVEDYVIRGRQWEFDAKFLPEWVDVLAWLKEERDARTKRRQA